MRQLCMIALCAVLTLALPLVGKGELSPQHEVIVYVSPHGNDAWSGQFPQANAEKNDGPLRTLAQARQTIHQAKQSQPNCNYTVYLRGGNYTLDQTLVLEPRDGSPEGYLTTFAAYESERVSIGSGLAIQGLAPANRGRKTRPCAASARTRVGMQRASGPSGHGQTLAVQNAFRARAAIAACTQPRLRAPG